MDIADEAGEVIEMLERQREENIRKQAAAIPTGSRGDCDECGEPSGRLVEGVCAPCRDALELIGKRRSGIFVLRS